MKPNRIEKQSNLDICHFAHVYVENGNIKFSNSYQISSTVNNRKFYLCLLHLSFLRRSHCPSDGTSHNSVRPHRDLQVKVGPKHVGLLDRSSEASPDPATGQGVRVGHRARHGNDAVVTVCHRGEMSCLAKTVSSSFVHTQTRMSVWQLA